MNYEKKQSVWEAEGSYSVRIVPIHACKLMLKTDYMAVYENIKNLGKIENGMISLENLKKICEELNGGEI